MQFQLHRPQAYAGAGDRYLPGIVRDLKQFLISAQAELVYDTLRLPAKDLDDLAGVLVEFAEDIHNDIGLWRSLEQYQLESFDTPLPLCLRPNEELEPQRLNEYRQTFEERHNPEAQRKSINHGQEKTRSTSKKKARKTKAPATVAAGGCSGPVQ